MSSALWVCSFSPTVDHRQSPALLLPRPLPRTELETVQILARKLNVGHRFIALVSLNRPLLPPSRSRGGHGQQREPALPPSLPHLALCSVLTSSSPTRPPSSPNANHRPLPLRTGLPISLLGTSGRPGWLRWTSPKRTSSSPPSSLFSRSSPSHPYPPFDNASRMMRRKQSGNLS